MNGRNNYQLFSRALSENATERFILENGLKSALSNEEMFLVYQLEAETVSGRITGIEVLLAGVMPNWVSFPLTSSYRLQRARVSLFRSENGCFEPHVGRRGNGRMKVLPPLQIAVNVSPIQLRQRDFVQSVKKALDETGLLAEFLELELTEGIIVSTPEVVGVLRELKEMGLALAIDDFGTGHSNLSYLRQFPVHKLKIDRSFLRDVPMNRDNTAITSTIIGVARSLDLKVIAEGVETEEQLAFLRSHRCDEFQGYYFSRPLPVDEFTAALCRCVTAARRETDTRCAFKAYSY